MKFSEIIAHVGDEHIKMQNLASAMTAAKQGKKEAQITFATANEFGRSMMKQAALGKKSDVIGLVIWIPRERLPEDMQ